MKNLIATSIALAAIAFVGSTTAEAGNGYRSFNGQGYGSSNYGNYGNQGYNRGFQNYGNQNYGNRGYGVQSFHGRSWGQQGHYVPHTTTHYDYHGPSLQRHGNHLDVVPGHFDRHTTTHFDYHRGH